MKLQSSLIDKISANISAKLFLESNTTDFDQKRLNRRLNDFLKQINETDRGR